MNLSYRDLITTVLAAATAGLLYARTAGIDIPYLTGARLSIVTVLVVGILMCIAGNGSSSTPPPKDMWTYIAMVLLAVLLISGLLGLITGNLLGFQWMAAALLLMWLSTTLHHAIGK